MTKRKTTKRKIQLVQYVRRHRNRVGVLMAVKTGENVHIAWSKCKVTGEKKDTFNPVLGAQICEGRLRGKLEEGRASHDMPNSLAATWQSLPNDAIDILRLKKGDW